MSRNPSIKDNGSEVANRGKSDDESSLDLANIGMEEIVFADGSNAQPSPSRQFTTLQNVSQFSSPSSEQSPGFANVNRRVTTIPSGSGFTFLASEGNDADVDELGGGFVGNQNVFDRDRTNFESATGALTDSDLAKDIVAKTSQKLF